VCYFPWSDRIILCARAAGSTRVLRLLSVSLKPQRLGRLRRAILPGLGAVLAGFGMRGGSDRVGLLRIIGEIDTTQFWPDGESDGDTIHIMSTLTQTAFP